MPYSSIKDAPKGLVGAGLSLAQINVWSKINDSAKDSGAREPAAVAWSQFKKLYRKVGDKWVKRAQKLEKLLVPLAKLSEWPKSWEIPEDISTIRSSDNLNDIEIPYIIKDRIILKEGVANGLFYPGEELEPCVAVLNEKPELEDVEARKRTSLFWDHDDACKNWLGEAKNFRWDSDQKAIIADVYLVDESAAKKTHYQLEQSEDGLSRFGISPRVKIEEKDGRATNIRFVSQALVLDPAGGPKLMLEKDKDLEEEIYEDLSLDPQEDEEPMQFKHGSTKEMKILAVDFCLTEEEVAGLGEEQLDFLRSVPKTEDILNDGDSYKAPEEDVPCPECGEKMPARTDKCSACGAEIKQHSLSEKTFCPECRYTGSSDNGKCPECGTKMSQSIQKYIESFSPILKIDGDEHVVKMIVLEPEVVDNHGHVVSENEIQNAMYLWMEQYKNTEVMHRDRAGNLFPMEERILGPDDKMWNYGWNDEFAILECFQSPIDYFEGEELVRKGSWVLTLRVNDENIWQKIKDKELTGASIGGHALLSSEVV